MKLLFVSLHRVFNFSYSYSQYCLIKYGNQKKNYFHNEIILPFFSHFSLSLHSLSDSFSPISFSHYTLFPSLSQIHYLIFKLIILELLLRFCEQTVTLGTTLQKIITFTVAVMHALRRKGILTTSFKTFPIRGICLL